MKKQRCYCKQILSTICAYRYKIPPSTICRVDRIKRISDQVLEKHRSKFGENFTDNKKVLDQISIVRSKLLKNEVAGYITKFIKKEIETQKRKESLASRPSVQVDEDIQDPDVVVEDEIATEDEGIESEEEGIASEEEVESTETSQSS